MIWFYLFIAILAQSGSPHITNSVPFDTAAGCDAAKIEADQYFAAEAKIKAPNNAYKFMTECREANFDKLPEPEAPVAPVELPQPWLIPKQSL